MSDSTSAPDDTPPKGWRGVLRTVVKVVLSVAFVVLIIMALDPLSLACTVIAVPFYGVLVRYRAQYRPRQAVALEDDEAQSRPSAPKTVEAEVESYWGVLLRVHRLEGFGGYWKGTVPTLLAVVRRYFTVYSMGTDLDELLDRLPLPRDVGTSLVLLPSSIVVLLVLHREIVAPFYVSWSWPFGAVCKLFGHHTKKLAILGTALSVLILELIRVLVTGAAVGAWRELLYNRNTLSAYAAGVIVKAGAAVVVCVLEIVTVRLSVQPFAAPTPIDTENDVSTSRINDEAPLLGASTTSELPAETVVDIRTTRYSSAIDCVLSIAREEGAGTLFRAYWYTLLFSVHGQPLAQVIWGLFQASWVW